MIPGIGAKPHINTNKVLPWAFDLSYATLTNTVSVSNLSGTSYSYAYFLSRDGSRIYVAKTTTTGGISIYQKSLSTPFNLASYTGTVSTYIWSNVSFNAPRAIFFSDDGYNLYILHYNTTTITQHILTTAWDVTTASYYQNKTGVSTTTGFMLFFTRDGNYFYTTGSNGYNTLIYRYTMSTPWDISTASHSESSSIYVGGNPCGVYLSNDGSKIFIYDAYSDRINEKPLATPYSVASGSLTSTVNYYMSYVNHYELHFNLSGDKMYLSTSSSILEFTLAA